MQRPFPTHVRRINEDVWLLSVVWLSNHVQCVYFKFRRRTQEISRNKMRRNWQCTEWKKLMTWITQPANRGQQEGERREKKGCRYSHCTLLTVLSGACKMITFHAAVTSSVFVVRLGFGGVINVSWFQDNKSNAPKQQVPIGEYIQFFKF